jgi:hypothetical protein
VFVQRLGGSDLQEGTRLKRRSTAERALIEGLFNIGDVTTGGGAMQTKVERVLSRQEPGGEARGEAVTAVVKLRGFAV